MTKRRSPIGIDVGGRSVSAVQFANGPRGPRLAAAQTIDRPSWNVGLESDEAARLADVLERQGFHGRDVVLAIPTDRLLTAVLELPPRDSGAPLDQISRMELAAAHKHEPDRIESAFWDLPTPARARTSASVMAVGCVREHADELLDTCEAAGLNVLALDVRSCAAARACASALRGVAGLAGILDIGWSTANLVVIGQGVVVYERVVPNAGLGRVHEALVGELGLDADVADYVFREIDLGAAPDAEAPQRQLIAAATERMTAHLAGLVPEIRMSIGYAAQEYGRETLDRMLIVGEAACVRGMDGHLGREFGVDTHPVAPNRLTDVSAVGGPAAASPLTTVACGLALYPTRGKR